MNEHLRPPTDSPNTTKNRLTALYSALAAAGALALATSIQAANFTKANNADDLNQTTSWSGGVVPGSADVAVWDSTVASANTTLLAANTNWSGLKILNPAGIVTINATSTNVNAGATLTLGASGLDMSAASQDLTFGAPVALQAAITEAWTVGASRFLTLNGGLVRASTGNSATLNFDTSLGGTINLATGTASALLLAGNAPFATVNAVDFASLDGSKNIVAGSGFYGPYSAGGSLNGTYTSVILDVTGTTAGATQAFRLGNSLTIPNGIRFAIANTQNTKWTVDTASSGRLLTTGAILITAGVGSQDVEINGPGAVRANGNQQDLVLFQNNPSGNLIFNCSINPATGPSASPLVKTGPGRVVLAVANAYTGPTRIEQGTLVVNGSINAASAVTVNSGGTLGGLGTVLGSATVQSGGAIAPGGTNITGTLTIGGPLTFNSGTPLLNFYGPLVPTTNTSPLLVATNTITVNGTVNVSILSGAAAVGQYPLIKWTNSIPSGTFSAFNLASLPPHVAGYLSNNTANSSIDLVVTAVNEPLTWAVGTGAWDINTSTNWIDSTTAATTFQQVGGLADSVVFDDAHSGGSPITVTLNTTVVPPSVTFNNSTKSYTLSGSGTLDGVGSVTKTGSGPLTLNTANSFTGGLKLNGGTVTFSSLTNLGGGPITFGGATLQYAPGNQNDISVRVVTLAAGGGTINDGGNAIVFANPIGNSGTGGLTKTGAGSLTLNGTNRYSGNTVVASGTLALAAGSYISNSAAIIVNSSALLDVSANGSIVLNNQILAGSGTVNGSVVVPTGSTLSPATNGVVGTLTIGGSASSDLTISGGALAMDVSVASRDLIAVNANLTINSGSILVITNSTALANGTYKLIQYGGALLSGVGSSGNLTIVGFSQPGKAAVLSDSVPGEIDLIVSDSASDTITWSGTGATWDTIGTQDWLNGANPWAYTNGDNVTFDDSGAATPAVSLQAAVRPGSVTVNNSAVNYVFVDGTSTGGGKISGTTGLTKNGPGTLTIDTINNNSGTTTINGGTLAIGDGATTGDIGTGNVVNNAALIFAQTDSRSVNAISGTGSLMQAGSATLTLLQNNTYTGPTTINSGTLQVGNGGANGTLGTADVTDNGTLTFNRSGTFILANQISGSGALTLSGTATVTITRTNTYSGTTSIGAGTTVKLASPEVIPSSGGGNNNVNVTGKLDLNGFNQTVSRLNGSGQIVSDAGTGTNVLTINYDGTGTADASETIADNDGTGSRIALLKTGTGSQIVRGNNTFTGGTIVSNGTLNVRANNALGPGLVVLRGGNLSFAGITFANTIQADTNATLDTPGNNNVTLTGNINTASNLTVFIDNNETWSWNGAATQLAGVTGTITITGGPGFFRFQASRGSDATTFDMTGSSVTMNSQNAGTFNLGALVGDSTPFLGAAGGTTFVIGGKNLSTTFAGTLTSINNNLVKIGTGTLTLSGPNGFTGSTTVSNGVLALAGSSTLDNSTSIAVHSGASLDVSGIGATLNIGNLAMQTLSGSGTVAGAVTATGGAIATINPGDSIGKLTINGALTLAGNSLVLMELNRTNAPATNDMLVASSFTVAGTLAVTNLGPNLVTGDKFKLFSTGVSGFSTIDLPAADSTGTNLYVWSTNTIAVDGSVQLISGGLNPVNTNPTNITFSVSGGQVTLSWPVDHTGWHLQAQTNPLSAGITTNWVTVTGSDQTNRISFPVSTANGTVFYRMVYP